SSRIKDGRISSRDIEHGREWFSKQRKNLVRIVVTHHPLNLPKERSVRRLAQGAEYAIYELAKLPIHIYLSGHHHRISAAGTAERYTIEHHAAIALQAGTVSKRSRGELQSFNFLKIKQTSLECVTYEWSLERKQFKQISSQTFELY